MATGRRPETSDEYGRPSPYEERGTHQPKNPTIPKNVTPPQGGSGQTNIGKRDR